MTLFITILLPHCIRTTQPHCPPNLLFTLLGVPFRWQRSMQGIQNRAQQGHFMYLQNNILIWHSVFNIHRAQFQGQYEESNITKLQLHLFIVRIKCILARLLYKNSRFEQTTTNTLSDFIITNIKTLDLKPNEFIWGWNCSRSQFLEKAHNI